MNSLMKKIASVPEAFSEHIRTTNAKNVAVQLFKDGKIDVDQFKTIDNSVDNSTDNSICQSEIGTDAIRAKVIEREQWR